MLCLLSIVILICSFVEKSFIYCGQTVYYPWHSNDEQLVLLKHIKTYLYIMIYTELTNVIIVVHEFTESVCAIVKSRE